jgi:DNA-binding transcriptional ArsR family regulator
MPRSAAALFAVLGAETRLQLAARLSADGPMSITKLAETFPMTRQAITKHLRVMEVAGIVRSTAQGREVLWAIDKAWDARLARLKRLVERGM